MPIKWRCTLCGKCCKVYVPLVLAEDVKHLQSALNIPLSSFLTFYRPTDFDGPLDDTYHGLLFQSKHGPLVMCLSRKDLPDGEVGCVFLNNNLCSVHQFRPLVCRQYPFKPEDSENIDGPFKVMDNPCFGQHAMDEIVEEKPIRENYRLFQDKQEEYLARVKEWNDKPESQTKDIIDFLSFVGLQWS